ncbi:hypothetical protein ACLB2K_059875 [Fragaria x ananassa]
MKGCRPLIGLDGCQIKGHHPGQLLTAIGIDANNGIFPIAYAMVERESEETWTWFLELQQDVKIERDSSYVFMTDKQKGLDNALKEHRHYVRHLHNNFKQKHPGEVLKQLMWNAARSTTIPWFNKHMDEMKMVKDKAVDWFNDKNPSHWSRAFFKEETNGFGGDGYSEVKHVDARAIPGWVTYWESAPELPETKPGFGGDGYSEVKHVDARAIPGWVTYWEAAPELPETKPDKSILAMLEMIRMSMMVRNANRRVACEKWKDVLGPRIKKMLDKVGQRATQYRAHRGGEFVFQVTGFGENGSQYAVDLGLHACTCKRWQLSGIPCAHLLGRPKKKRIPSQGENGNPTPPALTEGKLPKTGVTMTCKLCGQEGHNRVGCPTTKTKKAAEAGEGISADGASTKKRVQKAPAPPKKSRLIKNQVIKSKKGWKKMKLAMEGSYAGNGSGSASTQPLTQSSQNHAARGSTK